MLFVTLMLMLIIMLFVALILIISMVMLMLMLIMVFVTLMLINLMVTIVPWQLGHRWCYTPIQTRCDKPSSEGPRTLTGTRCIPWGILDDDNDDYDCFFMNPVLGLKLTEICSRLIYHVSLLNKYILWATIS